MKHELLELYKQEISQLREDGALFAKQFPDVAKRIDFANIESSDPHVERLLESFAFIAARINKQNETLMSEAAKLLLGCMYDDLVSIIPSVGLINFEIDGNTARSFGHTLIKRGENIFIKNGNAPDVVFTTVCDTIVSPVTLLAVDYVEGEDLKIGTGRYVHLKLKWIGDHNADKKSTLQFFITGARKYNIWEKIISEESDVYFYENGTMLGKTPHVESVGFSEQETIFQEKSPYTGFRSLIEYIVFPEKFLSFKVNILFNFDEELDIYVPIIDTFSEINVNNILLNIVPIVNFYYANSEPVFFDPKVVEQIVVPSSADIENERVHKILSVTKTRSGSSESKLNNYFDVKKNALTTQHNICWIESKRNNSAGKENSYISFVNIDFSENEISEKDVFYAKLICTNRNPKKKLGNSFEIVIEKALPISQIAFIQNITNEVNLNISENNLWKLISFLSLNSLSIDQDIDVTNFKGMIAFFLDILQVSSFKENLQDAIISINVSNITKHVLKDSWRGFVSGFDVIVEIDESNCNSPVLLGAVIESILSNFVHIDSFVCVSVCCRGKVLKKWSSSAGILPKI